MLFDLTPVDRDTYREAIRDRLPSRIIDSHTHVYSTPAYPDGIVENKRLVSWPARVAKTNPIEDLLDTYRLMFPDKMVLPLVFSGVQPVDRIDELNAYTLHAAKTEKVPSLLFTHPEWPADVFEERLRRERRQGIKVYLNLAPSYLPSGEIRIFDFLTHEHLEVVDRLGLIVMLHVPRTERLRDEVNLAQVLEIEERYANLQVILAHVGRAYCNEDVGDAFEILKGTERLVMDVSANTNSWVFARAMEALGSSRLLFGSDLPVVRMRMKRVCRDGIYMNRVPSGLYGDVSNDKNMEEVERPESDAFTFFLYEEILSLLEAADEVGLSVDDLEKLFYENARGILERTGYPIENSRLASK